MKIEENVFEGNLTTKAGEVYPYTKITGDLHIRADAKLPVLTSVGGDLDISAAEEVEKYKALLATMDDMYDKALVEISLLNEKLADSKAFCETLKSRIRNLEGR